MRPQRSAGITKFHVAIESKPEAVRHALSTIRDGLGPLALDAEELASVEVVMAEALNNVVEHAYPDGDPAGAIDIECAHRASGLHFRVVDHGRPLPKGFAPIRQTASIDVDVMDLPEGGFGWFLIRDLAREVQYQRRDTQNVLDLRMAVAKAA